MRTEENIEAGTKRSELENLAVRLAERHRTAGGEGRGAERAPVLIDYLDEFESLLREAVRRFRGATEQELALSYAAEWVLDNHYIAEQALREIQEDLPPKYYRQLPRLTGGPLDGYPRIYALAREIILHENTLLDLDRAIYWVDAYQSVAPLTMGELWAFPIMLRLGIIENLILSACRVTQVQISLQNYPHPQVDPSKSITDEEIIANCFLSLRTIAGQEWKDVFEYLSLVEGMLRRDPAQLYTGMDFETRDRYRKVVERVSMMTGRDELEVAREAIRLAQSDLDGRDFDNPTPILQSLPPISSLQPLTSQDGSSGSLQNKRIAASADTAWDGFQTQRPYHVGYYLVDQGRSDLENSLGFVPSGFQRLQRWALNHPTAVYIGSIGSLAALITGLLVIYALRSGGSILLGLAAGLIVLVPSVTIAVNLVNWLVTNLVQPKVLSKMSFEEGLPPDCSALVVIPTLLSGPEDVLSLLRQLELHFLRNSDPGLYFALLSDFTDALEQHMPGDDALAAQAQAGILSLNEKYGRGRTPPFLLLHRERRWNNSERLWMGWERKRGKLQELNWLILGASETSYTLQVGELSILRTIRYVITLDADTILPSNTACRLVAALAHPLNRAEFGPDGRVRAGYTVLQPRTDINPATSHQSLFTRVYSGDTGLDLYTRAVSDVYQDLFSEGIFVGKGIYDVRAFERSMVGRVPENALLSHDLFEGIHGRVALATDIVLVEDFPPQYLVQVYRLHRWVRGDWQLLPWLFPRVPADGEMKITNSLSLINRWKILDNLRRSLVQPVVLVLFVAGWLWLPGSPLLWTLLGLGALGVPMLTGLIGSVVRIVQGTPPRQALFSVRDDILRWFLALAFLPYEALVISGAILTTLRRLFFTRRHFLIWTTAAQSVQKFGNGLTSQVTWRQMSVALFLSIFLGLLVMQSRPAVFPIALPLLVIWVLSPEIAYWISRPLRPEVKPLAEAQVQRLRLLARQTWLFFEQFLGPEDHWLPPDHFQEAPLGIIAHRTSPTNIGLALVSTLGAFDLGYLGPLDLAARLQATFETLDQLERSRGHFYNWYDTTSLEVLSPRYISTVDSGNLAASLIALGKGCQRLPESPILRWQAWQGFLDTVALFADLLMNIDRKTPGQPASKLIILLDAIRQKVLAAEGAQETWTALLLELLGDHGVGWVEVDRRLSEFVEGNAQSIGAEDLRRLRIYSSRVRQHLNNMHREIDLLLPWLLKVAAPPSLFGRPEIGASLQGAWQDFLECLPAGAQLTALDSVIREASGKLKALQDGLAGPGLPGDLLTEACDWCQDLAKKIESAAMTAKILEIGFAGFSRRTDDYVQEMDFHFLFDPQRQVFHIGYNGSLEKLDGNYYDLLASEARIASLIAISKGDVPQSHWLHLARPFTQVEGSLVLLSWSATMFEYLMPGLFARSYAGTLLDQTAEVAVKAQIQYGKKKRVPWGISESGYYRFDANQYYQYRAFGIPGLGYKRGLAEDLVITPYASLLALSYDPYAVVENFINLVKMGVQGTFGLYEAVDFTPSRLLLGNSYEIVRSYMSHHQGMILCALVNYLDRNVMVERFHADPLVESVELLLQEQIPQSAPVEEPHAEDGSVVRPDTPKVTTIPWRVRVQVPQPRVHVLSNGQYRVLITNSGAGYSRWRDVDLTRWAADTTRNDGGMSIYVQDMESGALWSAGIQPTAAAPEDRDVFFNAHMAQFRRRDQDISLSMELTVPPEDDVEIRLITLTNHSGRTRRLRLTSYAEVVLAPQSADARHPAFNKLFIESEALPEARTLLFRRRPRSQTEEPVFLAHSLVVEDGIQQGANQFSYETDRLQFLGRGRTLRAPAALRHARQGRGLTRSVGATLDPILALSQEIVMEPHGSAQLSFVTAAASSRQDVLGLSGRYSAWSALYRAFDQARAYAEIELRQLGLRTEQLQHIQVLLSLLTYPHGALRADPTVLAANRKGQPGLWAYGISGDYPILLVRVSSSEELSLVFELLQAHIYWRKRKVMIDLVILNTKGTGYEQELNNQVHRLLARTDSDAWLNVRGGIFILVADQMGEADQLLLEIAAWGILDGDRGSLSDQLRRAEGLTRLPSRLPPFTPLSPEAHGAEPTSPLPRPSGLLFDNGLGGFSADGREYQVYLEAGRWTPAPWVNVVANPEFGFLVSESGGGFSWSLNSGENRLTPWSNDPVSDPPGEAIYLRDEETAEVWSPTPLPARARAPYLIRHGAGYTIFEHNSHGLDQRLRLFVAPDAPVKILQLRLENRWNRARRITVTYYAEWVLGVNRETSQQYIIPEFDGESQALLARNPYNPEFGERIAFAAASRPLHGLTADRTEFLGRLGRRSHPAALRRIGLSGNVAAGIDPCAALMLHVDLKPGEVDEVYFLLGQGADRDEAVRLVRQYQDPAQVEASWTASHEFWEGFLGAIAVRTPDPAMDLLLNRWLQYQSLSCRIWGRSAFYQSSGAYGFRDQLQDVMCLLMDAPSIARQHILRAARYQFESGDVLHWWHPPSGRGVRTRFSDDLLWLPYVTAEYIRATGDETILQENAPFLRAPLLDPHEEERYGLYPETPESYSLYEHCRRAVEKGATSGPHNLPLMGGGDWNDGMNRVGIGGQGESVWLGWFLYDTLLRFAGLCDNRGDRELASWYRQRAAGYQQALERDAWDGDWYLRAFYDDGTPLGSAKNRECQIDAIAQSWAVLSGAGDPQRVERAMQSLSERLIRPRDGLILLFTPPFDKTPRDPGYIKGYLPGIRENGGQYTHAALWSIWAFASLGQGNRAEELFRLINPIYHADAPDKAARYRVEPYVVAADVYGVPPHTGRGGWTWYTGSAGWMYRLGLEAILGLRRVGKTFIVDPCIPQEWESYEIFYKIAGACYGIQVENPNHVSRGVQQVTLDGEALPDGEIPISDDGGRHTVRIIMG